MSEVLGTCRDCNGKACNAAARGPQREPARGRPFQASSHKHGTSRRFRRKRRRTRMRDPTGAVRYSAPLIVNLTAGLAEPIAHTKLAGLPLVSPSKRKSFPCPNYPKLRPWFVGSAELWKAAESCSFAVAPANADRSASPRVFEFCSDVAAGRQSMRCGDSRNGLFWSWIGEIGSPSSLG